MIGSLTRNYLLIKLDESLESVHNTLCAFMSPKAAIFQRGQHLLEEGIEV